MGGGGAGFFLLTGGGGAGPRLTAGVGVGTDGVEAAGATTDAGTGVAGEAGFSSDSPRSLAKRAFLAFSRSSISFSACLAFSSASAFSFANRSSTVLSRGAGDPLPLEGETSPSLAICTCRRFWASERMKASRSSRVIFFNAGLAAGVGDGASGGARDSVAAGTGGGGGGVRSRGGLRGRSRS